MSGTTVATETARPFVRATTLGDLLDERAALTPDTEGLIFPGVRWTFGQFADRADYFARALVGLGVARGDRVAIFLPNTADSLAIFFAAAKVGAVPVPVNARFKSTELRHILGHSGCRVLVTMQDESTDGAAFLELLHETIPGLGQQAGQEVHVAEYPELRHLIVLGGSSGPGITGDADLERVAGTVTSAVVHGRQAEVRARDMGLLLYTSGTTAMPKGAMISHEALTRGVNHAFSHRIGLNGSDRMWSPMPFFHVMGLALALGAVHVGATFVHPGYFDPTLALDQIESERCTVAFPTFDLIWLPVLRHASFPSRDLSSVRMVYVLSVPERTRSMAALFPAAVHIAAYGSTEAGCFLAVHSPSDPEEKRHSTGGRPLEGVECRVIDPDTGHAVPPSTLGELVYRSPTMFDGYFRDNELTDQVVDADGFFRTGDLVTMDADGYLTFVSRLKDMLKVGGENVSAAEIEGYLVQHPAVRVAAVVGAPDAYYTEVPAAYIELEPGVDVSEQAIIEFCLGKIATFRVPRYVRIVTEWPMSGTKIKKYELRERLATELAELGITEAPRLTSRPATPAPA
jgi:fatty-acyl-CoA synthase